MYFTPIVIDGNIPLTLANWVSNVVLDDNEPFEYYLNITEENLVETCAKPKRHTLLHTLIKTVCIDCLNYIMDADDLEASNMMKKWMDSLSVDYTDISEPNTDDYCEWKKHADLIQDRFCEKALDIIANATFVLLFNNKDFLFQFNKKITMQIQQLKKQDYPDYLKEDGKLLRTDPPTWLKDGVFYRDRGRCQECGTDLSRIFRNGEAANYDHIIPVNKGGSNDPTNFQLMCEHCNKSKSDRSTSFRNVVYPFLDTE